MLFSPVMLHFYEPSGAEIQLKTPITSIAVSKNVIFPACQFPRARAPRDEGLFILSTQVEEEITPTIFTFMDSLLIVLFVTGQ